MLKERSLAFRSGNGNKTNEEQKGEVSRHKERKEREHGPQAYI